MYARELDTPLGPMYAVADDEGLMLCEFSDRPMLPTQRQRIAELFPGELRAGTHPVLDQAERELAEYFAGEREMFEIPLRLHGTTVQREVWNALLEIPFGTTTSYGTIADRIARPGAARAVGRANGDNRIAIIVPCHRVINADGSLSGYGGGKHRKRWLLKHEQRGLQLSLGEFIEP